MNLQGYNIINSKQNNFDYLSRWRLLHLPIKNNEVDTRAVIPVEYKNRYMSLFKGRKGVYAGDFCDVHGKRGYYKANLDFTATELEKMLDDRYSIGIYPLNEKNACRFIVVDIDIDGRILQEHGTEGNIYESFLRRKSKNKQINSIQINLQKIIIFL